MGLSEDEGRFGREEVRSMTRCIRGDNWFSTEEAVFERPNIRLASFVGVADGDGDIELNIIEKSRSDGLGADGGGAPCVFEDFGFGLFHFCIGVLLDIIEALTRKSRVCDQTHARDTRS